MMFPAIAGGMIKKQPAWKQNKQRVMLRSTFASILRLKASIMFKCTRTFAELKLVLKCSSHLQGWRFGSLNKKHAEWWVCFEEKGATELADYEVLRHFGGRRDLYQARREIAVEI